MKVIASNKKAYFDYEIKDEITCWIVLFWHEVKSLREKHVSMKWSFADIKNWELFITWVHISPYRFANGLQWYDPERKRKLLANRREIDKIQLKLDQKWFTLVPTNIWFEWNKIKVRIWVWKWKKKYEKKEVIKLREMDRELKKNFKF